MPRGRRREMGWPNAYNLTTLNLQSGDTLVWTFSVYAIAGPKRNQTVTISRTTQVE